MSMHDAGAVVFAKHLAALADFYERVTGLRRGHAADDHVVLESDAFRLVVHAIPPHIARDIEIEVPPRLRDDTAIKLAFRVTSLADARRAAGASGGRLHTVDREWEYDGRRVCDGVDPEGNVFQVFEPL